LVLDEPDEEEFEFLEDDPVDLGLEEERLNPPDLNPPDLLDPFDRFCC